MAQDRRHNEQKGLPPPLAGPIDPDQPLFLALRNGDQNVLADLMQRHGHWVRGVIYAVIGQTQEMEDVYQQVWLAVWRRADTLNDASRWRHWLYRMARNAAIDAGRRTTRQRGFWSRLTEQTPRQEGTPGDGPSRLIVREQYRKALEAIHALPKLYREPFILRHLEGWTYRQIGQALDLPDDTVETRLMRARRLLRETLGAEEAGKE